MFCGLVFLVRPLGPGWLVWTQFLYPLRECSIFQGLLPLCGVTISGMASQARLWLPLLPFWYVSFVFYYGGAVHLVLRSFQQENYPIHSCKFVLSGGKGEFRVFQHCHLEPPQEIRYFWDGYLLVDYKKLIKICLFLKPQQPHLLVFPRRLVRSCNSHSNFQDQAHSFGVIRTIF